ncbi:MAG: mannitol dehydrogenase family protein, partial [Ruegeria sp.]
NAALVREMSNPAIRIVSLTITEGGYFLDSATGKLDADHPDIRYDIANPSSPRTVFGAIVAALKHRREARQMPFTVQSCDNLQGNGQITQQVVVTLARMTDPDLARWIDDTAAFPNSMVDCIVPATGPDEITIAKNLGVSDAAPVTHENYRQWIIEDHFCAGRPDWQKVGAVLTDSVHAYETMKIRVLNAGHQVLANAGELLSIGTIAECMRDPTLSAFFRRVQENEILPYVSAAPNTEPADYLNLIEARFSNPLIKDTTRRVAFDGSSRHTGFVLPILRDAAAANGQIDGLCLVEALWARMCAGTREDGSPIDANDPKWAALTQAASMARQSPDMWLNQKEIYGELANDDRIKDRFSHWLKIVWDNGSRAAIDQYLAGT